MLVGAIIKKLAAGKQLGSINNQYMSVSACRHHKGPYRQPASEDRHHNRLYKTAGRHYIGLYDQPASAEMPDKELYKKHASPGRHHKGHYR